MRSFRAPRKRKEQAIATITIKSCLTQETLFEAEAMDLKEAVTLATKKKTDLRRADFRGADLRGADLSGTDLRRAYFRGADLRGAYFRGTDLRRADLSGTDLRRAYFRRAYFRGADLRGADLSGTYFRGADLRGADLRGADLSGTDLRRADLRRADLRRADLRGTDLRRADLRGAKIPWQSHDLISELLVRAAEGDIEKRKIAGLILVSRDWCWRDFLALDDPLKDWALVTLAAHVQPDDDAPSVLRRLAEARLASPQPVITEPDPVASPEE